MAIEPSFEQETSVVDVIKNQYPLLLAITQPVVHKLEYISLGIPPAGDLGAVCNLPIALLKPGLVACVDPKDPCFR
jgi:hypothetical protein